MLEGTWSTIAGTEELLTLLALFDKKRTCLLCNCMIHDMIHDTLVITVKLYQLCNLIIKPASYF